MLDEDRQEALDVLDDCLHWQLPARRWDEIEQVVSTMARSLAGDDAKSLRRATTELELLGPVRGASAEDPPPEPTRERVRERIGQLVTSLLGPRPDHPPTDASR